MATPVTKIYSLETRGFEQVHKELQAIAKDFENIKKSKKDIESAIATSKTVAEVAKYNEELQALIVTEQQLRVEQQKLANEAQALNLARQDQLRQQKAIRDGNNAEAGSIFAIRKEIRELNLAIGPRNRESGQLIDFRGQLLSFDQAIDKMKELTAAEQAFRRQFAADQTLVGEYTTGIVNAFKRMGLDDLIAGQVTKTQDRLNSLTQDFNKLQQELRETQAAGLATDSIEKQMIDNRNEVIKLDTELARLRTDLRGVGDVGNQINASIGKGFAAVKGQLQSVLFQYISVQAIITEGLRNISEARLSSDQFTDLEIQLNNDAEAAEKLNDSLKALDTRTTLTGLQQIADVALRAGTTAENITSVTEAIDKTKVAFGKDFGSVEQGTETFAKLINIFFDDGQITGDRILRIGNAVRALANETVASVPFLNDFAGRMAGLRQVTNITLPDVLGLGAGFEEFKQSAEVASTALVKVIPKMAADTERFAQILGITQQQFSDLIQNNPAEALISVSEALVKSGRGIEDVSQALADSELGSGRITTIIGTLGGKADIFRQRIARAGQTIQETDAITDAFQKKNENLAATMDKLNKKLRDAASSRAFQVALLAIVTGLTFLLNTLPIIIGLLTLYGLGWLTVSKEITIAGVVTKVTNGQLLLQRLALIGNTVAMGAYNIAMVAANAVTKAFSVTAAFTTGVLKAFGIALKATPLRILLTGVGLLVPAVVALAAGIDSAKSRLSELTEEEEKAVRLKKFLSDASKLAAESYASELGELEKLVLTTRNSNAPIEDRKKAYEELQKIYPDYFKNLSFEEAQTTKLTQAYDELKQAIIDASLARAAESIVQQKAERLAQEQLLQRDKRLEIAKDAEKFESGISNEQIKDLLKNAGLGTTVVVDELGNEIFLSKESLLQFDLAEQNKRIQEQLSKGGELRTATLEQLNSANAQVNEIPLDFERIRQNIREAFIAQAKPALVLDFALRPLQQELDEALEFSLGFKKEVQKKTADVSREPVVVPKDDGKLKDFLSKRLIAIRENAIKEIDAMRDAELTALELAFRTRTQFIRREQDVIEVGEDGKIEIVRKKQAVFIRDEEEFLREQQEINNNATALKIASLQKSIAAETLALRRAKAGQKIDLEKSIAEELRLIQTLNLERERLATETNQKIFDIRANNLKQIFDADVASAKERTAVVEARPDATETERLEAKLQEDKDILEATIAFNRSMDALEKERNLVSKKNAEDRAREARLQELKLQQDIRKIFEARVADEKKVGERLLAEFKNIINRQREAILNSNKTPDQKNAALKTLEQQDRVGTIAREIATLKDLKGDYDKALAEKRITEEEYAKFYEGYVQKLKELNDILIESQRQTTDIQSFVTNQLSSLFGFEKNSDQAKLLAATISQSFDLAKSAMDSFYDAEQAQIQRSLELNTQRLEIERDQMLQRANSKAEEESINRQFQAKQDALNRDAFEKNKKIQRAQAKINLAMQLSNLAVIAFAPNPLNIATLGVAGAVMYAIQAAIALANYALNISRINSASFEEGGMPGQKKGRKSRSIFQPTKASKTDVPTKGGKFRGKSHKAGGTPFEFKGRRYEAEVDELAVIRTRNAPKNRKFKVEGTQMQIASAINRIGGGVDFKPGATIKKFETGGYIGQSLQAPIFNPAINPFIPANQNNDDIIQAINEQKEAMMQAVNATNARIDRVQVVQVTSTVSTALKKQVRQQNIGTL